MRLRTGILIAMASLFGWLAAPPGNAAQNHQFRGMWVNAWSHGLKSEAEIDHMIAAAREANINALLVEVRRRADALYHSSLEPMESDVPPGFDPLATVIRKAHAAGIEVHAWMVMMPATSAKQEPLPPGNVYRQHPDWATWSASGAPMHYGQEEGIFLDPGVPAVQDYLVAVARDLVTHYAVDGLHLDYIRYPGRKYGYNPVSVRRFKDETGHTPSGAPELWSQWRRQQVDNLVRRISEMANAVRPGIQMSAAVFPDQDESYNYKLQDWGLWLRRGWIDFVVPMNYTSRPALFASRSGSLLRRGGSRVYMGVYTGSRAGTLAEMSKLQKWGVNGMVLYHYAGAAPSLWQQLRSRIFTRPLPPPVKGQ